MIIRFLFTNKKNVNNEIKDFYSHMPRNAQQHPSNIILLTVQLHLLSVQIITQILLQFFNALFCLCRSDKKRFFQTDLVKIPK